MNWHKLMKEEVKELFNDELSSILCNCGDVGYKEFNNYMKDIAKKVVREDINDCKGWFEFSADLLMPLIDKRNKLLSKARSINGVNVELKQQCRNAKNDLKDAVAVAKGR